MIAQKPVRRRRALQVIAAAAGLPLLPASFLAAPRAARSEMLHAWNGAALGAPAQILLCTPEAGLAGRLIDACTAEIERLERIFSLYRPDSELARLNRKGRLDAASHDLISLLDQARRVSAASGGAFDSTIQPLWRLYFDHFAADPRAQAGPSPEALAGALALVDWRAVEIADGAIRLRPGMAITLNGIAQGYITDRIADLLRDAGLENVLVNLGEFHALGAHPGGRPWRVGIEDPLRRGEAAETVELTGGALATSAPAGTLFDRAGRWHHLLDARTGRCASQVRSVSVQAPRATMADALSTAIAVAGPDRHPDLVRSFAPAAAMITLADGRRMTLG